MRRSLCRRRVKESFLVHISRRASFTGSGLAASTMTFASQKWRQAISLAVEGSSVAPFPVLVMGRLLGDAEPRRPVGLIARPLRLLLSLPRVLPIFVVLRHDSLLSLRSCHEPGELHCRETESQADQSDDYFKSGHGRLLDANSFFAKIVPHLRAQCVAHHKAFDY